MVARSRRWRRAMVLGAAGTVLAAWPAAGRAAVRNVILMIGDGAGYNTWLASAMWEGRVGRAFLDGPEWERVAVSVYPLAQKPLPADAHLAGGGQDPTFVYDPARAWDGTPEDGGPGGAPWYFAGYRWLRRAPDSANTGTALATGHKTYVGAINVDGHGRRIERTLPTVARSGGRAAGVVTSVPFSHATPAALGGAHATNRHRTAAIALEMLVSGRLDVIAGCGNPGFDGDGRPVADPPPTAYAYVGGRAVWDHLRGVRSLAAGDTVAVELPDQARAVTPEEVRRLDGWTLVQDAGKIAALAEGPVPDHLLVVPEVGTTLQEARASAGDRRAAAPGDDPLSGGVPSLETLTRVALNALDDDPDGFYLMVEGGAIDWAMHDNALGRTIEEAQDFERAVGAVEAWVERHGGWDETLLVVTADHDHLLWGPNADAVAFDPLADRGPGRLPGHRWLGTGHSNALVPLFARGAVAETFPARAAHTDPVRGAYLDQTDVFRILAAAMEER